VAGLLIGERDRAARRRALCRAVLTVTARFVSDVSHFVTPLAARGINLDMRRTALVGLLAVLVAACTSHTTADTGTSSNAAVIGTRLQAGDRTAAVYEVRDNLDRGYPPSAGQRWIGIDAEVCVAETDGLDIRRWQIRDATDQTHEPTLAFDGDVPDPRYRDLTVLNAGQCVRGWIAYEIPTTDTIGAVLYFAPNGTLLTWTR
jgi:hypothetical protein